MNPLLWHEIPSGAAVSIANRGQLVFLNNRLRPPGLSAGQFPVLMLLAKKQDIMQETLVRHYRLDKGTIARAVKKLEAAGFIRRIVDPANRRAVRLYLTGKGERSIPALQKINREWETQVYSGLSGKERVTLHNLMRTVAGNSHSYMQGSGGVPGAGE